MRGDDNDPDRRAGTVRQAEPRDYAAVRALYGLLQDAHAKNHPQLFNAALGNELTDDDFLASLEMKDRLVLVVERGGTVVAAAQANLLDHPGDRASPPRRWVHVTHLVTRADARRRGYGRALVNAVAAWARLHDAGTVEFYVWQGSPEAAAFYRALGYRTVATLLASMPSSPAGSAHAPSVPTPRSDR